MLMVVRKNTGMKNTELLNVPSISNNVPDNCQFFDSPSEISLQLRYIGLQMTTGFDFPPL